MAFDERYSPQAAPFILRCLKVEYAVAGKTLLSIDEFSIASGGPLVVLGPNGAGKTTLLKICHGLLAPTAGEIHWESASTQVQAMVLQRPVLLRRSVRENIAYALRVRGDRSAEPVAQVLNETGLTPLAERPARLLSGGEQQRVALARAWVLRPTILFLDEPTSSLDPAATRAVEEIIARISTSGTKVILTTHDLGQAQRLSHEIAFLHGGRLVEHTPAARFFAAPQSDAGAAFIRGDLLW